jgi:hypothetical protein
MRTSTLPAGENDPLAQAEHLVQFNRAREESLRLDLGAAHGAFQIARRLIQLGLEWNIHRVQRQLHDLLPFALDTARFERAAAVAHPVQILGDLPAQFLRVRRQAACGRVLVNDVRDAVVVAGDDDAVNNVFCSHAARTRSFGSLLGNGTGASQVGEQNLASRLQRL